MKRANAKKRLRRPDPAVAMLSSVMAFYFLGFLMLAVKNGSWHSFLMAIVVPVIIFVSSALIPKLFPADKMLLTLTNFLCALGVLVLYYMDPSRGLRQALYYGLGVGFMLLCILLVRFVRHWKALVPLIMAGGLAILGVTALFGQTINGAQNWFRFGSLQFQPSEVAKLALIVALAYLLSRRKDMIAILFSIACMALLVLQADMGTAIVYYGVTVMMLYTLTGKIRTVLGCVLATLAAVGAVYFVLPLLGFTKLVDKFQYISGRFNSWLNPWADPRGDSYQLLTGLIAIANGGLWGVGLGQGNAASSITYAYNDFIFPVILHEFGAVFGVIVLLTYVFIIIRAVMIARRSRTVFHALLAVGCAALIGLQTFVIVGGNLKLIPLTGVTLPFISYGGTSLVSSLCVMGLLQGVASVNEMGIREDRELAMRGGEAE